ncbi:MAG: hypothetical protein ACOCPO_01650 [Desulfohalobiaceae bacterium]
MLELLDAALLQDFPEPKPWPSGSEGLVQEFICRARQPPAPALL